MKKLLLFIFLLFFFVATSFGQSTNFTCATALSIQDPIDYCSSSTEFTTANSGGSELVAVDCFQGVQNDVYFSFTAIAQAVNIVVNGEVGGSLRDPRLVLYEGNCQDVDLAIINCEEASNGNDLVNLFQTGLVIGETYLVRVGGAGSNQGSFQLCINNYNPPIEPGQDFEDAAVLCDKSGFVIQTLSGGGQNPDEAAGTCLDVGFTDSESQSSWTSWVAANDGTLTFAITPLNYEDDIDFVLWELPNGIDDFSGRIVVRCMASGCAGGGPTGLDDNSTDVEEPPGCPSGNDNFLQALSMEEGKAYALLINNFTSTGIGISLNFGGTGEFVGPDPDFSIIVDDVVNPSTGLVCDKIFQVQNEPISGNVGIVEYEWNFGEDAIPQTAIGEGPFDVQYLTFGKKYIALTVSSDIGCKITEVREVDVGACCSNSDGLDIEVTEKQNLGCIDDQKGLIGVSGVGGFPDYDYSFNGEEFSETSRFENLELGDYEINVRDRKGCEARRTISVLEADPLEVDAGPDASVEFLGDSIQLNASYPGLNDFSITWEPTDSLRCEDGSRECLNPIVTPLGTTTYKLSIIDFEGCNVTDEVVITVLNVRPLFAPNVFSPNEDGFNDIFTLFGNEAALSAILEFDIYDRWGNQVYSARNISLGDLSQGWDGKLLGEVMEAGVYIWYAKLKYIDPNKADEVITGDITLLN
jgi:gliding motility-associated-like protein